MNRALAYFKLGQIEKAIVALEDIHKKNWYAVTIATYIMAGEYEKAMEYNLEVEYDDEDPVISKHGPASLCAMNTKGPRYFEKAFLLAEPGYTYHLSLIEARRKHGKGAALCPLANDARSTRSTTSHLTRSATLCAVERAGGESRLRRR